MNLALLRLTPSEQGKEDSKTKMINVCFTRELVVKNALATNKQDNDRLLSAIKEHLDRVDIGFLVLSDGAAISDLQLRGSGHGDPCRVHQVELLSRREWNKILAGVDAEFEVAERDQKKNRRKIYAKEESGSRRSKKGLNACLKLNNYPGGLIHMELVEAANKLTNYMGTAYILSNLAALLADTYISRFKIVVFVEGLEFLHCNIFDPASRYEKIDGANVALLFAGLYMLVAGCASVKAGRDEKDPKEARQMSNFFNGLLLAVCVGGAISLMLIVWIQDNRGWNWGFGISSISLFLDVIVFASGLPIYRIQVIQGNSPIIEIIQLFATDIFIFLKTPQISMRLKMTRKLLWKQNSYLSGSLPTLS
ncbi:protein NRT1/ PTR FAMILY 8.3-like [Carya illinoinensis]|uniref:protein NRT1/ PTR FAMILY 8.3-like n=1 Tax=Carya illinoinensis TaxID=32201 RepID=UPI001C722F60|nr:protein NRT1/ PTR FAMILY 8.3-like [Carya illinoinensis]